MCIIRSTRYQIRVKQRKGLTGRAAQHGDGRRPQVTCSKNARPTEEPSIPLSALRNHRRRKPTLMFYVVQKRRRSSQNNCQSKAYPGAHETTLPIFSGQSGDYSHIQAKGHAAGRAVLPAKEGKRETQQHDHAPFRHYHVDPPQVVQ